MDNDQTINTLILKHVLINAYQHKGKAYSGAIISRIIGEKPSLKNNINELIPVIEKHINEINSLSVDEQLNRIESDFPESFIQLTSSQNDERELPSLPNAEKGNVITRFSPNPNGYLHIGHAKAIIINYEYSKKYEGKFILRFDDTNPKVISSEYYDEIINNLEWLGIKPDSISNASDFIDVLYDHALTLLQKQKLYICECDQYTVKKNRLSGSECDCRNNSENDLDKWNKLFSDYNENEAIVRYKGNMKSLNTPLRDPTMFRIIDHSHEKLGDKIRLWPSYDFATPVIDSLQNITHALRSKEFEIRNELHNAILDHLNLKKPLIISFSRLNIKNTPVSKSLINKLINDGSIENWSDLRLPTLENLRKRGFKTQSIHDFVTSLGLSKSESEPTWDLLESINRKLIDATTKRCFFVSNPVKLFVSKTPKKQITLRSHPTNDLGNRSIDVDGNFFIDKADAIDLKVDDQIRLMDLYNVKITSTLPNLEAIYLDDDHNTLELKKIHWVNTDSKTLELTILSDLFKNKEFNDQSLIVVNGLAENTLENLHIGETVQFIRIGFCRIYDKDKAILTHK